MTKLADIGKAIPQLKDLNKTLKAFPLEFSQLQESQYLHNWKWGQGQGTDRTLTASVMFHLLKKIRKKALKSLGAAYCGGEGHRFPQNQAPWAQI